MGLSLNSEEVQKNLALMPAAANVSGHLEFSLLGLASGAEAAVK